MAYKQCEVVVSENPITGSIEQINNKICPLGSHYMEGECYLHDIQCNTGRCKAMYESASSPKVAEGALYEPVVS